MRILGLRNLLLGIVLLGLSGICLGSEYPLGFGAPAAGVFSTPAGIVFPTSPTAAFLDPAAFPFFGKSRTFEVANAPSIAGPAEYGVFAGAAAMGRTYGVGAGYLGDVTSSVASGFFAGTGFSLGKISLGLGASKQPTAGAQYSYEASMAIPMQEKLRFAMTVSQLQSSPQLQFGVGYQGNAFDYEFDVRLPPLNKLSSGYLFLGGGSLLLGRFDLNVTGGYQPGATTTTFYTGGIGFMLNPTSNLMVQYSSTNLVTLGLRLEI